MYLKKRKRGLSPVISQVILAAAVLTIGGGVWYFSLGYCSITADGYIDETLELMNVAIERFTVERVSNNTDASKLAVWINNYGEVELRVDVYADSFNRTASLQGVLIPAEKVKKIELDFSADPMVVGESLQIKIYSWRQNFAYMYYTVH
ncbi:hypothetical protein ACFL0D_00965 [Thermoproteota archaeon]